MCLEIASQLFEYIGNYFLLGLLTTTGIEQELYVRNM